LEHGSTRVESRGIISLELAVADDWRLPNVRVLDSPADDSDSIGVESVLLRVGQGRRIGTSTSGLGVPGPVNRGSLFICLSNGDGRCHRTDSFGVCSQSAVSSGDRCTGALQVCSCRCGIGPHVPGLKSVHPRSGRVRAASRTRPGDREPPRSTVLQDRVSSLSKCPTSGQNLADGWRFSHARARCGVYFCKARLLLYL